MTYSIVVRDPDTGDLGVALQSHWFNVGRETIFGIAGVGVAATQSFIEPRYGEEGLAQMDAGASPGQVLSMLLASDQDREFRQVALLSAAGEMAVHTGSKCIPYAGHVSADNVCCQANLMTHPGVPEAMLTAYLSSSGTLALRLLSALEAAQQAGGDLRGKQAAGMLVVKGDRTSIRAHGIKVNLRVEDSQDPLCEMRRLINLRKAYDLLNMSNDSWEAGDIQMAHTLYAELRRLEPNNEELVFWAKAAPAKDRSCLGENWLELGNRLNGQ